MSPKGLVDDLQGVNSLNGLSVEKMNISFAGCGFLGLYHVGVASCFREYCPQVSHNKISGCSVGAICATAMACQVPMGDSTSDILRVAIQARSRALGPFHPTFDVSKIVFDAMDKALPEDAHLQVNGRLHISVTRVSDGKNVILTEFDSKEDLIQAVLCSSFIPFWSGIIPPKFHGVAYMDGGFTNNLLILDDNTVTVTPFAGESDICPQDDTYNVLQINVANTSIAVSPGNIYRLTRILFPPHPEVMSKMCQQGFDDALRFLQRNNKISCLRCVAIKSCFVVAESENIEQVVAESESEVSHHEHSEHSDDDCIDCQYRREMAVLDSLPDPVARALREGCDQVDKGLINWIFKHQPIKLLSLLTVPYVLPFDIAIVVLIKLWRRVPWIKRELKQSLYNLINFTKSMVMRMESKRHLYSAKFSCQMAVTQYDYSAEEYAQSSPTPTKRQSLSHSPFLSRKPFSRGVKLEKSHSFHGRRISSVEDIRAKFGQNATTRSRTQRKSYAGSEFTQSKKSLIEPLGLQNPERVLSKMNFGFTVDLSNNSSATSIPGSRSKSCSRKDLDALAEPLDFGDQVDGKSLGNEPPDVMETLKLLSEDNSPDRELRAIDIANRALNSRRECMGRRHSEFNEPQNADSFDRILEATSSQEKALMAFYYLDDNNRVKITEIFNIPDETASAVFTPTESEDTEHLEWDSFIAAAKASGLGSGDTPLSFGTSSVDAEDGFRGNTLPEDVACPQKQRRKGLVMLID